LTAQEAFDELVRDGVWPALQSEGFKRTRATFHRPVGRNWQVIDLQKSKYSDRRSVSFTVNLAVGLDLLREGVRDWEEGKRPAQSRCHLGERLGYLLRGEDTWWEIRNRRHARKLARTLERALRSYAIPWLDARSTEDALAALVGQPEQLRAEPLHHVYQLEKLMARLGREDLRHAAAAERERKEDELERLREIEEGRDLL
jgi:hypothetical protein